MQRFRIITYVLSGLFILAVIAQGASLYRAHREACDARNKTLDVLQAVMIDAQLNSEDRQVGAFERVQTRKFFTTELARINAARCK